MRNTSKGIRVLLLAIAALLLALPATAAAATIDVNTGEDEFNTDPAQCSLREAVQLANEDLPGTFGGCTAADQDDDVIELDNGVAYLRSIMGIEDNNEMGDIDIKNENLTITAPGAMGAEVRGGFDRVFETHGAITVTMSRFTVEMGVTVDGGGGVKNNAGILDFNQMLVQVNNAGFGGGIENIGTLNATNTTIAANFANGDGGGLHNGGLGVSNLNNATVFSNIIDKDNNGSGVGGGVMRFGGSVFIRNTILADNGDFDSFPGPAPDCAGSAGVGPTSVGNNMVTRTGGCNYAAGPDEVLNMPFATGLDFNLDPNGGPTETLAVLAGSPAVDGGNLGACPPIDQRGVPRPQGLGCDIGAYESPFSKTVPGPGGGVGAGAGGGTGNPGAGAVACVRKKKKRKKKRSAFSAKKKKKKKGCGKKKRKRKRS